LIIDKGCTKKEFCLFHVTPCLNLNNNKIALIGEQSKWVPVSPNRVLKITSENSQLQVQIQGAANETVEFSFMINEQLTKVECKFIYKTQMNIVVSSEEKISVDCF
jgi:hypothetical protein